MSRPVDAGTPLTMLMDARKVYDYGIGTYIRALSRALSEVAPDRSFGALIPRSGHRNGLPASWKTVPVSYGKYSAGEYLAMGRVIQSLSPAVFHSPHFTMPRRPGVPSVVTIQDVIPLLFPKIFNRAKRTYARWMISHAVRVSHTVIATSETTKRALVDMFGLPAERVEVIPLGVSKEFFVSSVRNEYADRFRSAFGIERPYILFVGNPKPHKGLDVLLRAYVDLRKRFPELELVIAGGAEDSLRRMLTRLGLPASVSGSVKAIGRTSDDDLIAAYAGAEVLAFPSMYEGFGLPALEAMAAGTPVVCSDGGALAEVAGDAAVVVPAGDAGALRDAIASVVTGDGLKGDLAARGVRRAERFTWNATAHSTLACYERVIGSAHGGLG